VTEWTTHNTDSDSKGVLVLKASQMLHGPAAVGRAIIDTPRPWCLAMMKNNEQQTQDDKAEAETDELKTYFVVADYLKKNCPKAFEQFDRDLDANLRPANLGTIDDWLNCYKIVQKVGPPRTPNKL